MNRRDFLASLSAAGGMAASLSFRVEARVRFGYAAITWNGNDRQAIDDIAALGFRGIQLRQSAFDTWGDRPAELKDLLAQKGLVLVALSSGNVSLDPATEQATLARHAVHARFVRDVGGRYLQVIDERPRGTAPVADDYRRMGRLLTAIGQRSIDFDGWGVVELDSVPAGGGTPKESGAVARRYLETLNRWNDAS